MEKKSTNSHRLSVPKMSEPPSATGRIQFNTMVALDKESGWNIARRVRSCPGIVTRDEETRRDEMKRKL